MPEDEEEYCVTMNVIWGKSGESRSRSSYGGRGAQVGVASLADVWRFTRGDRASLLCEVSDCKFLFEEILEKIKSLTVGVYECVQKSKNK